jgi:redox-sensitive bicupin YhaK (pirin superfamily)
MSDAPVPTVLQVAKLGFPWQTVDPFLFCVHHDDAYPAGDADMGPAASLEGRRLGQDFTGKDGWRMYHGLKVPGFPQHPHRGFETVTIARRGFIDHSDSLGATARFGRGDAQWMTAGKGVVHCEMFPLVNQSAGNPLELFQIWLNLPSKDKLVDPYFTMLWNEDIPRRSFQDANGGVTDVTVIAGRLGDATPSPPPPDSWAAKAEADVAIWTLKLSKGAKWTLPRAAGEVARVLYFFKGPSIRIGGQDIPPYSGVVVNPDVDIELENGPEESELLMLQGRPIDEPVAQQGPFVMNTEQEVQKAYADYRKTGFGGWPWPNEAPVHPRETGRFAQHADGRKETRET